MKASLFISNRWLGLALAAASAPVLAAALRADTILNSPHDLSAVSTANIRAVAETEVCLFCHTPHRANEVPLWNHALSAATYIPYQSTTAKATFGQPSGASKLCLSCHDGTVALGMVASRPLPIPMQGGVTTLPPGRSNLGTDLSDDHPVSFTYDAALAAANGQLRDPAALDPRIRLEQGNQLQCTACHDPHDNRFGKFLVMDNNASALCVTCHDMRYWTDSSHRNSNKSWNGAGLDPWPHTDRNTVSANGCQNCHTAHHAGTHQRLLVHAIEEQNCFSCHNGNVASKNIAAEFDKASVHPIQATINVHDPAEDPINPPRHVECADCHNPHASRPGSAPAPNAGGPIAGTLGVNSAGLLVNPVTREYELCYRCHADSVARGPAHVPRQFPETNTRLEFSSANASYHPVEAAGKNPNVPSLIPPWTTASLVKCTDCHNNDQGPGAGGGGPNGPHGSAFAPLLERQLLLNDFNPENALAYALCYKCHSRSVVTSEDPTSWKHHKKHVVDKRAACTTCHDPHGVQGKTHLINFNTLYVTPSSNGRLEFVDLGVNHGNCSLTCHGKDHKALSY